MNPSASSARPVSRSQGAPPARVTQTISSASIDAPAAICRLPAATRRTSALHRTATPRAASTRSKAAAHRGVVGGQDALARFQQVKAQLLRVAAEPDQFVAQAVLHREGQLDAARAGADHRDARDSGVPAHALQQRQPARVEGVDRLDRHRMRRGAFHAVHAAAWSRC